MPHHFKQVTSKEKKLIHTWLHAPHVKEFFYGQGLANTLHNLDLCCKGINNNGDYTFYYWVAFANNEPFAFLMTSIIEGPYDPDADYNKWYVPDKKTYTLDILIGETSYLGKGLAHTLIQDFILTEYAHADYFLIDPEAKNSKAIHVYEKAGFNKVGEFYPEYNPTRHIMMRLETEALKT